MQEFCTARSGNINIDSAADQADDSGNGGDDDDDDIKKKQKRRKKNTMCYGFTTLCVLRLFHWHYAHKN